jgi:hypothetical protein
MGLSMTSRSWRKVAGIAAIFPLVIVNGAVETGRSETALPNTLEDIYGDTGNSFQAAIGFIVFEGGTSTAPQQSYGLAVDDMVMKWREFVLDPDAVDCAVSGSCALIGLTTTNVFEGQTVLTVTVVDSVPDPDNDCDLDGTADETRDCNNNTIDDVVVRATSEAEVTGEIVYLDKIGDDEYRGVLIISSLFDSPGVLFLAPVGVDDPTVTVTYLDNDIDPGPEVEVCPNDVDPAKHGRVQKSTEVFIGSSCEVVVARTETTDNGDGDEFVDTEETADMRVCVVNNCGMELHECTGRLFSNSPNVDCILDSTIDMGDLANTSDIVCIDDAFRWRMADSNRTNPDQVFEAEFRLTMTCDEIDALSVAQEFATPLDLDFNLQGQTPRTWVEDFEDGDLEGSIFFAENLDTYDWPGYPVDGWRCQYSDPDWVNSNSYGSPIADDCFVGMNLQHADAVYWQVDGVDTLTDPPGQFTTPMAVVESVATSEPINLGIHTPELSWWHQVSLIDGRSLRQIDPSRSADRGVVQYKTVGLSGGDTSDWTRLEPFQNAYDTQAYDFYFNCMFDPVDDGSTEDDFYDPTDPNRRLGPSSTCFPQFTYSCVGDTDTPFQVDNICNASVQPGAGDAGDLGTGTWVQSKVDLTPLRGRRIKLRYLVSSLKAEAENYEEQFGSAQDPFNPNPGDDGWWIDDVTIDETLSNPAIIEDR